MNDARERALTAHHQAYGAAPAVLAGAPGRVNLVGEHTDYNDGLVLPFAIDARTWVGATSRPDRLGRMLAVDLGKEATFDLDQAEPAGDWADLVRGVAVGLGRRAGPAPTCGFDLVVAGDVPIGAGLSSSASLGVAATLALGRLWGLAPTVREVALLVQEAEASHVGVRCGIMDPLVSAAARRGAAILIDCRDLAIRYVPWGLGDHRILVLDSRVRRRLAASGYNARRDECEAARQHLAQTIRPGLASLRDLALADLPAVLTVLPPPLARRIRHVLAENDRVLAMQEALARGDAPAAGRILAASHRSLRDDFEVSTPELDHLVSLLDAVPGILGARLVGAGFGGSVIALSTPEAIAAVTREVVPRYLERTGLDALVYPVAPGDGPVVTG